MEGSQLPAYVSRAVEPKFAVGLDDDPWPRRGLLEIVGIEPWTVLLAKPP